jgi:anti-anti-sigma factor
MQSLHIERSETGDTVVFAVAGELDLGSADTLDAAFATVDGNDVIVDLRRLEFMDSVGLTSLLRAASARRSSGNPLRVIRGPRCVDRVFDLAEVRSNFEFVEPLAVHEVVAENWLG